MPRRERGGAMRQKLPKHKVKHRITMMHTVNILHEKMEEDTGRLVRVAGVRNLFLVVCKGQLCSKRVTARSDNRKTDIMIYPKRGDALRQAVRLNEFFECQDFAVFTCVEFSPLSADRAIKGRMVLAKAAHERELARRKAKRQLPEFVPIEDYPPIAGWNFERKKPSPTFPVIKRPKPKP